MDEGAEKLSVPSQQKTNSGISASIMFANISLLQEML